MINVEHFMEEEIYSNKVKVNKDFETNIKGLYVAEMAGITRGLCSFVNGIYIARKL